ncbi:Transposase IS4 [Popillia japonica]|uniref:Transposase IS4 n=1 Tax=Popillia japonica TaxID=7064 RepID=A0AAW1JJI8_POPJA
MIPYYGRHGCKQFMRGPTISVDESMIPYYGRHGCKQFMRGQPIRFEYELWVAAYPSGYIYHVEPYCGCCKEYPSGYIYHVEPYCDISIRFPETGLGQRGDVVIGLIGH